MLVGSKQPDMGIRHASLRSFLGEQINFGGEFYEDEKLENLFFVIPVGMKNKYFIILKK